MRATFPEPPPRPAAALLLHSDECHEVTGTGTGMMALMEHLKEVTKRLIVATMDTCRHALRADERHRHHGDAFFWCFYVPDLFT